MKKLILFCVVWIGLWCAASGVGPVIRNPSFEESSAVLWPGFISGGNQGHPELNVPLLLPGIPGWTNLNSSGLNPVVTDAIQSTHDLLTPFSNNGLTPDGKNVAFIQNGSIFQTISGFEAGRYYQVHFWCNGRAGYAPPHLEVSLGGIPIFSASVPAVQAVNVHTEPYQEVFTDEFQPPDTGAYDLLFSNSNIAVDSSILFDAVSIEEFSRIQLTQAALDPSDATKVTAMFSEKVKAAEANDAAHYSINSGIQVLSASLQADGQTVVLTTSGITDLTSTYELVVSGLTDSQGRRMALVNSKIQIQLPPAEPPHLIIETTADGIKVSWLRAGADAYALQATTTLLSESWVGVDATGGDDVTSFFLEGPGFDKRFYRLAK